MKTIGEINERIQKGEAVVVTAEEIIELRKTVSPKKLAKEEDVVTTGTFGPMCGLKLRSFPQENKDGRR